MHQPRENNPHFVTPPLTPPLSPPVSSPPPHPRPTSRKPKKANARPVKQPPPPLYPSLPPANVSSNTHQPHPVPPIPYVPPREMHHYQPPPEALLHPRPHYPSEEGQQPQLQPGILHHSENVRPQQQQQHQQQQLGKHHPGQDFHPVQQQQQPGRHHPRSQDGHPHHQRSNLRITGSRRKTRPITWLIAALCTLFWIIIIVGGLSVLIIYLVFHPRLPKFDISSATLNAAYLDMGYLLNADFTILGNFTNPNKKVNVDFNSVVMELYHERAFIATRYIEPFTAARRQSRFQDVHMITSQVPLTSRHSQELKRQMDNGRVKFEIKGYFRARSNLGGFLRYSYWLYSHCTITVTGPPSGVMIAKKCVTKR